MIGWCLVFRNGPGKKTGWCPHNSFRFIYIVKYPEYQVHYNDFIMWCSAQKGTVTVTSKGSFQHFLNISEKSRLALNISWSRLIEPCMSRPLVWWCDRWPASRINMVERMDSGSSIPLETSFFFCGIWSGHMITIFFLKYCFLKSLRFLDMLGIISGILNCSSYIFPWNTCHIVLKLLQSVFFSYAWCLGLALFFFGWCLDHFGGCLVVFLVFGVGVFPPGAAGQCDGDRVTK